MHYSKFDGDLVGSSTTSTNKAIGSISRKPHGRPSDNVGTQFMPLLESHAARKDLSEDDRAVLGLRNLIFDICNKNGGGHGGSALGMAAIGVALYKYVMRYNPLDSEWFDRDRFVLSNGKHD